MIFIYIFSKFTSEAGEILAFILLYDSFPHERNESAADGHFLKKSLQLNVELCRMVDKLNVLEQRLSEKTKTIQSLRNQLQYYKSKCGKEDVPKDEIDVYTFFKCRLNSQQHINQSWLDVLTHV